MTAQEGEVREHLGRQYAGVFQPEALDRHLQEHVGFGQARELLELVRHRRPDVRSILDVGCGYGSFVLVAREAGLEAVGIEQAEFELAWARRRLAEKRPGDRPEAVYIEGDARSLPFADSSFDVVCFWNVIEHVPDARHALQEGSRVVRRGGSLFIIAPNYASVRREAHYHVPWLPLLPKRLAIAYLRVLGRDPGFYAHDVHPCTLIGTVRALRRNGLALRDPRAEKLSDLSSVNGRLARHVVRALAHLRLLSVAWAALRLQLLNPFAPTISIEAVKR